MHYHVSISALLLATGSLLTCGALGQEGSLSKELPSWELSPYRVNVCVVVEPSSRLLPQLETQLSERLAAQTEAAQGGIWRVTANQKLITLRARLLRELPASDPPPALETDAGIDKVIFVAIREAGGQFQLTAREWDALARLWNIPVTRTAAQIGLLESLGLAAVQDAFGHQARIESHDKQGVTIRLRAGALPRRDGSYLALDRRSCFRPVIVQLDQQDQPQPATATVVPWTYLTPQSGPTARLGRAEARCTLTETLAGDEVIPPYHPRQWRLAIGLARSAAPLRLKLVDEDNDQHPLEGYEVRSQSLDAAAEKFISHGLTNRQGELEVAETEVGLRWIRIFRGEHCLASRPVVHGLQSELNLAIQGDRRRLELAAALAELNDDLLDALSRHVILIARQADAVRKRDFTLSGKVSQELRANAGDPRLAARLAELEKQVASTDEATQQRLASSLENAKRARDKLKEALGAAP